MLTQTGPMLIYRENSNQVHLTFLEHMTMIIKMKIIDIQPHYSIKNQNLKSKEHLLESLQQESVVSKQ